MSTNITQKHLRGQGDGHWCVDACSYKVILVQEAKLSSKRGLSCRTASSREKSESQNLKQSERSATARRHWQRRSQDLRDTCLSPKVFACNHQRRFRPTSVRLAPSILMDRNWSTENGNGGTRRHQPAAGAWKEVLRGKHFTEVVLSNSKYAWYLRDHGKCVRCITTSVCLRSPKRRPHLHHGASK